MKPLIRSGRILAIILFLLVMVLPLTASAGLTFGVTPYLSEDKIHESFDPLLEGLSRHLGETVSLYIARDYNDLTEKMRAGLVDIGAFSPFAYVEAADKAQVRLIATACVDGKSDYKGLIVARKDKPVKTLGDLRGKTMAFVDPKSASGFVYPRALLVKHGYNPDDFFKQTVFAGSHDKVIDCVLTGKTDGGATYDGALSVRDTMDRSKLVILAETEPIPYDAYTVRQTLDEKQTRKIQSYFLGLSANTEPLKTMLMKKTGLGFSRWIPADDARYDVVRETAAYSGRKKRIALWSVITTDREFRNQKIHEATAEMLGGCIAGSRRFTLVSGSEMEKVLFQEKRRLGDALSTDILTLLLKQKGVDVVLAAELNHEKTKVSLSLNGYDTRTGQRAFSETFSGPSLDHLDTIIQEAVVFLQKTMPLEAYIIGIKGRELSINTGSEDGVRQGMAFEILGAPEDVKHSAGQRFERKRRTVGEGRFLMVKGDTSTAEMTAGDPGQIDVGSRIRIMESGAVDLAEKNKVYTLYLKGIRAMAKGDDTAAAEALKGAIGQDPSYAMAHARLSTVYFNLGMKEEGFEELDKAASFLGQVSFQERNYILARQATERSDLKGAVGFYQKILDRYPQNTSALHNLGLIYANHDFKGRDPQKARDCFQRVLVIDPDADISRKALANLDRPKKTGTSASVPVDVMVVFDTTGSMGDEIDGMIQATTMFADILRKNGLDFQLGLVTFGDTVRDAYSPEASGKPGLTRNVDLFKGWLKNLTATGGDDVLAENPIEAMKEAARYPFRNDAGKIIILITDAAARMKDSYTALDMNDMIRILKEGNITVFAACPVLDEYKALTTETGGRLYGLDEDFSGIIGQIGHDIEGMF